MRKALSVFAAALLIAAIGVVSAPGNDAQAVEYPGIRPQEVAQEYPGADNVQLRLECQFDGYVRLILTWTQYNLGIQFVDLTLHNNGWLWGTFIGIGPFFPGQSSAVWEGLIPNARHYVRINTLAGFSWFPSQTYSFTTSNCGFQQPFPPFPQPFPPFPQPIPPFPQPPVPGPCVGNSTAATYQAGNCPPPTECPATATILIFPAPLQGCVFPRRGTGATYFQGEWFEVCYWVNQPMFVRVIHNGPSGQQDLVNGYDDGTGGCVWAPTPLGGPGQRTQTLLGGRNAATQQLDTTNFVVQ